MNPSSSASPDANPEEHRADERDEGEAERDDRHQLRERQTEQQLDDEHDDRVDGREDHHPGEVPAHGRGDLIGEIADAGAAASRSETDEPLLHRGERRDEVQAEDDHDDHTRHARRERRTDLEQAAADRGQIRRIRQEPLQLGEEVVDAVAERPLDEGSELRCAEVVDQRREGCDEARHLVGHGRRDQDDHETDRGDEGDADDHDGPRACDASLLKTPDDRLETERDEEGERDVDEDKRETRDRHPERQRGETPERDEESGAEGAAEQRRPCRLPLARDRRRLTVRLPHACHCRAPGNLLPGPASRMRYRRALRERLVVAPITVAVPCAGGVLLHLVAGCVRRRRVVRVSVVGVAVVGGLVVHGVPSVRVSTLARRGASAHGLDG